MLKYILAAIILPILVFLMGAFIAWDINPGNWTTNGRYFCVCIMAVMSALALACGAETQRFK